MFRKLYIFELVDGDGNSVQRITKNRFEKPELQVILLGNADIITASAGFTLGDDVWTPWLELDFTQEP